MSPDHRAVTFGPPAVALALLIMAACGGWQGRTETPDVLVRELVEGIVPIRDGPESTGFGIFGTTPESPDGQQIVYVLFPRLGGEGLPDTVRAELWVCDRDLRRHRKLTDVTITNHNGANAFWVSDDRIAFQEQSGVFVISAITGERLLGPYDGWLGHDAHEGRLLLSGRVAADAPYGLYELDGLSGNARLLMSLAEIARTIADETEDPLGTPVHLQYSSDGSWISFRGTAGTDPLMVSMRSDGSEVVVFPRAKPLHQLWYDDDTYMGVWRGPDVPPDHDFQYHRWDIRGRVLEKLAGMINHGAASPDRQWYAGEAARYGAAPIRLALYRRGSQVPTAVLWEYPEISPVWVRETHVNPSFSRDGRRLYFWMPVGPDRVRAAYFDLSDYVGAPNR